jgi:hypothetical protein
MASLDERVPSGDQWRFLPFARCPDRRLHTIGRGASSVMYVSASSKFHMAISSVDPVSFSISCSVVQFLRVARISFLFLFLQLKQLIKCNGSEKRDSHLLIWNVASAIG